MRADQTSTAPLMVLLLLPYSHSYYCGCGDFCQGKCRMAGPGHRENLTLYRVTPYNLSGLDNKNTGDPAGDLFFRLGDELWLRSFCRAHPELHYDRCEGGNWADAGLLNQNVYASFTVETDGSYGPYSECNPVDKNASNFQCAPNYCDCPRALSAVGFYNLSDVTWGPPALPHPYDMWKYNANLELASGPCGWFSTTAAGKCRAGERPPLKRGGASGCSWRIAQVDVVINASCLDRMVVSVVKRTDPGQKCFARCGDESAGGSGAVGSNLPRKAVSRVVLNPKAHSTGSQNAVNPENLNECELNCFYTVLFGGANGSTVTAAALPRSLLIRTWENAFSGGCPALPPPEDD